MELVEMYPSIVVNKKSLDSRSCKLCEKIFWHVDPTVQYCGDLSCNSANLDYKTYKGSLQWTPSQLIDSYTTYFRSKVPKSVLMDRAPLTVPYSSTSMMFLCAGCTAYEALIDQKNPRSDLLSNILFISSTFCYRFYDKKQVSTSNRHCTGFFMLGLHCFESLKEKFAPSWKVNWVNLMKDYFIQTLKIPVQKIYFHGDHWTDGVNGGPSVEFFINGLEIANLVFTTEKDSKPRALRYVDMGMGAERLLNLMSSKPYAFGDLVRDHLRSLIVGLVDGLIPSKVGVGYNLRKLVESLFSNGFRNFSDSLVEEILQETFGFSKDTRLWGVKSLLTETLNKEYERCRKSGLLKNETN